MIRTLLPFLSLAVLSLGHVGCDGADQDDEVVEQTGEAASAMSRGEKLFEKETFGGNGRTCGTCHGEETGTISPEDVQERLAKKHALRKDALFRHDGLDDEEGGTSRIAQHATIRVEIPLPPNVTLKNDPDRRSIIVHRGVPSTLNTPALDPVLMTDGRAPNLQEQAHDAITSHAQATRPPTELELDRIAEFQQSDRRFFSSDELYEYAQGGPAPGLPEGTTDSERRGREMFVDAPFDGVSTKGICALCHSGPMLNETNDFALEPLGAPPGAHFGTALVSQRNTMGNEVYEFIVDDGFQVVEIASPDPGVMLNDPPAPPFTFAPRSFTADFFKTPQMRGIELTAPYFHDNSAKTLDDVAEHYAWFYQVVFGLTLTAQDQADMVAYMKLL